MLAPRARRNGLRTRQDRRRIVTDNHSAGTSSIRPGRCSGFVEPVSPTAQCRRAGVDPIAGRIFGDPAGAADGQLDRPCRRFPPSAHSSGSPPNTLWTGLVTLQPAASSNGRTTGEPPPNEWESPCVVAARRVAAQRPAASILL